MNAKASAIAMKNLININLFHRRFGAPLRDRHKH
jgi:hypothetical protein